MKKLIALIVMGFVFTVVTAAFAETPQEKMGRCSSASKGLKGEEYKAAKNKCLSDKSETPVAKKETPQERMSRCSKEAKGLKGEEYKTKKNKCLSNKG